jgi:hypothetical protein
MNTSRPRARVAALTAAAALVGVSACSVYDTSLLSSSTTKKTTSTQGTTTSSSATGGAGGATPHGGAGGATTGGSGQGGATGQGGTTSSSSSGGAGGAGGCTTADDCPGTDSVCATRTCAQHVCGVSNAPKGTPAGPQTKGTCEKVVCDGKGGESVEADDTNVPADDGKQCTVEGCASGVPQHTPKAAGAACNQAGGAHCTAAGDCVECLVGGDCASGFCDGKTNLCVAASCKDGKKNGNETDVDCGGACSPCALGLACLVGGDCASGSCVGSKCAPTCTDGVKDGDETDVDCGGSCPTKCEVGKACSSPDDCSTGNCPMSSCACVPGCACDHLVVSQIRSRGAAGAFDEFIELYNPTSAPVTLDKAWTIDARSPGAASYTTRYLGTGGVIPSHGHFLVTGSAYAGGVKSDAALSPGIKDAASVRLLHSGVVVDAVCYSYSAATLSALTAANGGFTCNSTPASNLPHDDTMSGASNSDAAIERKPGGAQGNCGSTGDDSADWATVQPATPRDTASAPAP